MTTATEGRELTQAGPGTVMGELMRQYWIPAFLADIFGPQNVGAIHGALLTAWSSEHSKHEIFEADAAWREADRVSRQRR